MDHLRIHRYLNDTYYCLFVGRSDGRLTIYPYEPSTSQDHVITTSLELTGIDCESIKGLSANASSKSIWTASYGGVLRYYEYIQTHQAFIV